MLEGSKVNDRLEPKSILLISAMSAGATKRNIKHNTHKVKSLFIFTSLAIYISQGISHVKYYFEKCSGKPVIVALDFPQESFLQEKTSLK